MGKSVAGCRAPVGEGLAGLGHELPVKAGRSERQLQHAKGVVVLNRAAGRDPGVRIVRMAARSCGEGDDSTGVVASAPWVLWEKALVAVVVRLEQHVGTRLVKRLDPRR